MSSINDLGRQYADTLNRDSERKKKTIIKLLRFGWGLFSYFKGPPIVEGDLSKAEPSAGIAALSQQVKSGFQDVKLELAVTEGIDLVTGWVLDLVKPNEMQIDSQVAMLAMCRGYTDNPLTPQPMPGQYPVPRQLPSVRPTPYYPQQPQARPTYPRRRNWRGRMANADGQWVYVANDADDIANADEE